MSFLFLVLAFFALFHLPGVRSLGLVRTRKDKGALAFACAFVISGSMHFTSPERFLAMIPPQLPEPLLLVYVSGVFEILGALGLAYRPTRRLAGIGVILLLLAIFPANVYVAMAGKSVEGLPQGAWYYWARLPFQFVYIAWVWWCSQSVGRRF